MKKLFVAFLATLSFSAFAGQPVPIVWPFGTGSAQANFIRVIVEQANKEQTKYTFYYDNKPGAGGTVAARYVQDYKGIAILSSSSSFWVRPQFYPNESYKNSDFVPVLIECTGQPYSITSKKYHNIEALRQQKNLNIGLILGSLTEANARQLQKVLPDTQLNFIGYQSTTQPALDLQSGVLDLTVELPAEVEQWINTRQVFVIGASGTVDYPGIRTWYSQGIKGFEGLVSNYQMVVSNKTDPATVKELHTILSSAAKNAPGLQDLYDRDRCVRSTRNLKQTNELYSQWLKYWPDKLQSLKK